MPETSRENKSGGGAAEAAVTRGEGTKQNNQTKMAAHGTHDKEQVRKDVWICFIVIMDQAFSVTP